MDALHILWSYVRLHPILVVGGVVAVVGSISGLWFLDKRLRLRTLLKSQKFCRNCGGRGKAEGKKCAVCNGSGTPPVCPVCDGDGRVEAEKRCSYCMGTGVVVT